jgi:hypothetical protein
MSCASDSWHIRDDVVYYQDLLSDHPGLLRYISGHLEFAAHLPEYADFVKRLPSSGDYDTAFIYYEIALYDQQYFFYWSGVRNGRCTAYYTTSGTPYERLEDCDLPRLGADAKDIGDDLSISDGEVYGLTIFRAGMTVDRRFSIPPTSSRLQVSSGMPPDGDLAKKIESIWNRN